MDPGRFDNWTRKHALRLSRRGALKLGGASAVAAVLPNDLQPIAAQTLCSWTIRARTAGGPSSATTFEGTLTFSIGSEGGLVDATFTPTAGSPVPVTGIATSRSIDFQIPLTSDGVLILAGTAGPPVELCQGAAAGVFSGPQPGDLGAWQVDTASGSTGASQQPSGNAAPALGCPPPQSLCGGNCCPGGAVCSDPVNGVCACPDGSIQCGITCVQICPEGQDIDLNSCSCISELAPGANCLADRLACFSDQECCSGFCTNGECRSCGGLMCNGSCIDPNLDNQTCGSCGNDCGQRAVCVNGVCDCAPDGSPCEFTDQCCSRQCGFNGFCGCVQLGETCGAMSDCCGNATDGQLCVNGICVFPNGHSCTNGSQCFNGTCSNGICGG
jgi:hypothetical protein